ncbi:MAG: hypothetical protein A3I89_02395 [Candidatus Harrisonbacteria bacterium RIFCSPLOWO2_02_FULL_41_11]|uniref:Uncharacterized protein n=1 Tax=Candidatus Harrisonbacteria bacterium RIFCSPHIGHO2_02_FULL_42_16 TaxID=1798404 RepID=A0A1G1ZIA8_9BACT|nr:MAG: hypothetical protein A3B92_03685 [Candidatus Harrisonbacteria bacterium RIFCSPHIGHO2_02_FULL_42_16]OGY66639.1 MAG: hypothetical protein A3I89_02395 [Candidatus Harrisonbacteria bacterium RIFCSPLOWO2_02_FULL_41_11]
MTTEQIADIENKARTDSEDVKRKFLKQRVGRFVMATLLGKPDKPNFSKADSYLYKGTKLHSPEAGKVKECYVAARIIDEIRKQEKNVDSMVSGNWLGMSCLFLEDLVPISVLRDGACRHISVLEAAKASILYLKKSR